MAYVVLGLITVEPGVLPNAMQPLCVANMLHWAMKSAA
jgi:hypothetical protein